MKKFENIKNKGFTIVEVIIVVAILAVLTGVSFMGIALVTSRPVDDCAQKLQVSLKNNRISTMGKLNSSVKLYRNADDYIVMEEIINGDSKKRVIGERDLTVEYVAGGVPRALPQEPGALAISFERSSGALKKQVGPPDDGTYVEKIVISRGERKMEVCIERLTGRVYIE